MEQCPYHEELAVSIKEVEKSNLEIKDSLKGIIEQQSKMGKVTLRNGKTREITLDEFFTEIHEGMKNIKAQTESIDKNTALITDGAKMYNAISNFVKKHKTAVMVGSVGILLMIFDKSYVWDLITNYIKNLF